MVDQAKQVFYITDQENKMWSVALQGKRVIDIDEESHSNYDLSETPFSRGLPELIKEDDVDNEHGIKIIIMKGYGKIFLYKREISDNII